MKLFLKTSGVILGVVLAIFLAIWGYGQYRDFRTASIEDWKARYEETKDSVQLYKDSANKRLVHYETVDRPVYIRDRTTALSDPSVPASTKAAFKACDIVLSACDSAQSALKGQVRNLERQVDLLEHKPGPPRFQAYGKLGYEFLGQQPVIRVGAEGKLLGPISAWGEGEFKVPSATKPEKGSGLGALAGLRVNF